MKILSLHASPERGFPRTAVSSVQLKEGFGIVGDRKAGKRENRAVLLMGQATYDHLQSIGLELPYGSLGENIVLDVDPHTFEIGTKLHIADAILEISLYCTPCKTLRDRYGQDFPQRLGKRRGMLARVIAGGTVQLGDAVEVML